MKRAIIYFYVFILFSPLFAQQQTSDNFIKACEKLNDNYRSAIRAFEAVRDDNSESYYTKVQATIVLANLFVDLGETAKIQEQINMLYSIYNNCPNKNAFRNIPNLINNYKGYIQILKKQKEPFIDRISGLWVSAEVDESGCPCLALLIGENSGNLFAYIHPYCKFAEYLGNGIYTENIVVDAEQYYKDTYMYFGDVRFRSKNSTILKTLSNEVNSVSQAASESVAVRNYNKPLSGGNIGGQVITNILGGVSQGIINELSVAKTHYYICDISGTFGQGDISYNTKIYYTDIYERSDEIRPHQNNIIRSLNLYKVSKDDGICFISKNDRVVAPIVWSGTKPKDIVSDEEYMKIVELSAKSSKKPLGCYNGITFSIPTFNEYAYTKFRDKILSINNREEIKKDLKYGALGYGVTTYKDFLKTKRWFYGDLSGAYYRKDNNFLDSPDYYGDKKAFIRIGGEIEEAPMGFNMINMLHNKYKNFIPIEEDKRKKK